MGLEIYMKKILPLLLLMVLASCGTTPVQTKPEVKPDPIITPSVPETPVVEAPASVDLSVISNIAKESSCSSYKWKDRSKAPAGYIRGMALAYAREICFPSAVANQKLGSDQTDALTWLKLPATSKALYTMIIGAGMRESSGKYCEGKDASASNATATTAEAGLFQTSYNAMSSSPELKALFNDYRNNKHNCIEDFKDPAITCTKAMLKNWGTGDGLVFQELAKSCPVFAVQVKAITSRVIRKHYGPINRKEVEYNLSCESMLTKVESVIKTHPELCEGLK